MSDRGLGQDQSTNFAKAKPTLKQRVIKAFTWTMAGYVGSQAMRLGGNLILTRLLVPKVFGLMTLVQTFIIGLEMFSDLGIKQSIIQHQKGDDPDFQNTAWTIQAIRGGLLWIGTCLTAWPASHFYGEPMLIQLLPVVGLGSFISGFNSTKLAIANRKLNLKKITFLNLVTYCFGLIVMIVLAWITRSVWAIVFGGLVTTSTKTILSHVIFEGTKNRFYWSSQAYQSMYKFGRWVFGGTALTFLVGQGDRLLLGRFMDIGFLGIFTIASYLSTSFLNLVNKNGDAFLFPTYAELVRDRPEQLYSVLRRTRLIMICSSWAVSLVFIIFGQPIIDFLYDDRYTAGGWMLQLLAISSLVGVLNLSYSGIFLAKGRADVNTYTLIIFLIIKVLAIVVGFYIGGQNGVIYGLALTSWLVYPLSAIFWARLSIWQPEVDLPFYVMATLVASIALLK